MLSDDEVVLPCAGKLVFDTKEQALAMAVTLQWRHGTKLRAYECQHCELWHLSSNK